jgi:hypothetical protein
LKDRLVSFWGRWNWIPSNFEHTTKIWGNSLVLALLALTSLCLTGVSRASSKSVTESQERRWRLGLAVLAGSLIAVALACNELVVASLVSQDGFLDNSTLRDIRWFQAILISAGVSLLILKRRTVQLIERLSFTDHAKLFGVSLLVPWLLLLILLENGLHLERFWWLWPLQVIALAALATYVPQKLRLPRLVSLLGSACLAAMILNPVSLLQRVQLWGPGWSGTDAAEMGLANYVAEQLKGRDSSAIGYQIRNWPFMVAFNAVDPRYKVGLEFDLLYKTVHSISNTNQCAEGISPDDEFRIVQVSPTSDPREGYFDVELGNAFRLLHEFGPFHVYQRASSTHVSGNSK